MTGLIIGLSILLFLVLLLFAVPLHITVSAGEETRVFLRVLFVKFSLYPKKEKKKRKKRGKKRKKTVKKSKKAAKKPKEAEEAEEKATVLTVIFLIRDIAKASLRRAGVHLHIRLHVYEIAVATGDAAKTAILCGACGGASENLFALLSEAADFKTAKGAILHVYPDFLEEKTRARIKIDFYSSLYGILATLLAAGFAYVKNKNGTKMK